MHKTEMAKVYLTGWQFWIFSLTVNLLLAVQPPLAFAQDSSSKANNNAEQIDIEPKILSEINRVRTSPQDYAQWLESQRQYYDGIWLRLPGEKPVRTNKGKKALEEAIAFLKEQQPLPALTSSDKITSAATSELANFANANNIQYFSYGRKTPSGIVMDLVVDELFPDRRRRLSLLSPEAEDTGVVCKPDPRYAKVCAIAYSDSDNLKPQDAAPTEDVAISQPEPKPQPEAEAEAEAEAKPVDNVPKTETPKPPEAKPTAEAPTPEAEAEEKPQPEAEAKPQQSEEKPEEAVAETAAEETMAEETTAALPTPPTPQAPPTPETNSEAQPEEAEVKTEDLEIVQAESEIEEEQRELEREESQIEEEAQTNTENGETQAIEEEAQTNTENGETQAIEEAQTNTENGETQAIEEEVELDEEEAEPSSLETEAAPEVAINSETAGFSEIVEKGALESGDRIIEDDGSLYDFYPIEGKAGESFTISLKSDEFDAFVAVVDSSGKTIGENDDISQEDSNSQIEITLPADGVYNVIVNTYDENGTGEYVLTVNQ